MKHVDEHTIELYVLGERFLGREKSAIEKHLRRCAGCRELEQRIRTLYATVEEELAKPPSEVVAPSTALVRSEREVDLWDSYHSVVMRQPTAPPSWWRNAQRAIVRRPVAAALGSLALIAAISLVVILTATSIFKDTNPSYVHYNIGSGLVEVYNRANAKLWEMPSNDLKGETEGDNGLRVKGSVVADLEGKGNKVVVSTVRMADDGPEKSLRIIDGRMKVLVHLQFGVRHVQFRGKQYDARFNPNQPTIVSMGKNKEIVLVVSNGRSPTAVARYDASGKLMGEYWHFGVFRAAYAVDLDGNGKEELVLIGSNDVGRRDEDSFPTIVVLDPSKINGESECSVTRGFGLPVSTAELYYARLDLDEICGVFKSHPFIQALLSTTEGVLRFATLSTIPGSNAYLPCFEFVFDKQMVPIDVKNEDQTVRELQRLKAQGKTSITLDSAYLEKIKHAVRYWDGRDWSAKVVRVDAGIALR